MEGYRYADDSEPGWYSGAQYSRSADGAHAAAAPYDSGAQERPSGAFRLPAQPLYDAPTDPLTSTGSHARPSEEEMPRVTARGPEYPTVRPTAGMAPQGMAPQQEPDFPPVRKGEMPTSLVPPVTVSRAPDRVYRTRRSFSSVLVAAVLVILFVPVVRLLLVATFSRTPSAPAIVPAVLLTLGFTLSGVGLFAVAGGGTMTRESWLRPPVAYLPAGLILLLAAGLAAA